LLALGALLFPLAHRTAPLLALASPSGAQHGTGWHLGQGPFSPAHCTAPLLALASALAHSTALLALGQWLFPAPHGTTAGTSSSGAILLTAPLALGHALSPSTPHGTLLALVFSSSGAQHGTAGGNGLFLLQAQHGTTGTGLQLFWRTAQNCWHQ
jgi:hypothetical protein